MKHNYLIFTLIFLVLSFQGATAVDNLTPEQLLTAQKNGITIIDIRTPGEWSQQGVISKASKITFYDKNRKPLINEFMAEFQKLVTAKDQPFILVCRSGNRSGRVAKYLNEDLGYSNVSHLQKGMNQWEYEKRPVEK